MKKMLLIPFLIGILSSVYASEKIELYVAAKAGLSLRDKPDVKATSLTKIPYGTKITITYPVETVSIISEGMRGSWVTTTFGGKTGYVVDVYLLPVVPPKAEVKTLSQYLAQLSAPFGSKLIIKSDEKTTDESEWELHKQLYKNGNEWHHFEGYEYGSDTYFLPKLTIPQGFLLLRLIPEFKDVWNDKDEFPIESKTIKKGETEYGIKVEKEMPGDFPWVKMIKIEFAKGAVYYFEIYQIDNQLVIFYGAGV